MPAVHNYQSLTSDYNNVLCGDSGEFNTHYGHWMISNANLSVVTTTVRLVRDKVTTLLSLSQPREILVLTVIQIVLGKH